MKNIAPNSRPPGICPNASGNVSKINPAPPSGSRLNWNTSGNIARPASSATPVSSKITVVAERGIEKSFGIYAPKTIRDPMPIPIEKNAWPIATMTVRNVTFEKSGSSRNFMAAAMSPAMVP